jgi:hypothetical protein
MGAGIFRLREYLSELLSKRNASCAKAENTCTHGTDLKDLPEHFRNTAAHQTKIQLRSIFKLICLLGLLRPWPAGMLAPETTGMYSHPVLKGPRGG